MDGEAAVAAARDCLGTPFRPQGRLPGVGLDCIGLAAVAVRAGGIDVDIPAGYALFGGGKRRLAEGLERLGFVSAPEWLALPGDLLLFQAGHRQQHLGICAGGSFIHAHLGLRRVVETPLPAPWPLVSIWRFDKGD